MARIDDFTTNKIENFGSFYRLNSFVYRELDHATTVYENISPYLLIIFVIRKNHGFVEFYNSGEKFFREFERGDIVVSYSFFGYLPIEFCDCYIAENEIVNTNNLDANRPTTITISQELCELLMQAKYIEENMLFNEKVFLTFKRTTKKEEFDKFAHYLIISCGVRMAKHEIFTFFRRDKIPKMLNF